MDFSGLTQCPITMHSMTDPVSTSCGHTFEHEAIKRWVRRSKRCPVCRKSIARTFTPNYLARGLLEHAALPLRPRTAAQVQQEVDTTSGKLTIKVLVPQSDIVRNFIVWPRTRLFKIRANMQQKDGLNVQLSYGGVDLTDEEHPTAESIGLRHGDVLNATLVSVTL